MASHKVMEFPVKSTPTVAAVGAIVTICGAALAAISTFLPVVTLTADSSICVNQCFGTLTSTWWGFTENVDAPQGGADFVSFQAGWLILACQYW